MSATSMAHTPVCRSAVPTNQTGSPVHRTRTVRCVSAAHRREVVGPETDQLILGELIRRNVAAHHATGGKRPHTDEQARELFVRGIGCGRRGAFDRPAITCSF
jgi:hypothetical protein